MKKITKFFRVYWLEFLILTCLLAFPLLWEWVKIVLADSGLTLPVGFYLACELIYDSAAALAVYHTGFLQGWVKQWKGEIVRVPLIERPLEAVRLFFTLFKSVKANFKQLKFNTSGVRFWFGVNRIVALLQPAITLLLVFRYATLPALPYMAVVAILTADLVSTTIIIIEVGKRIDDLDPRLKVRLAQPTDLDGILAVDHERYGKIGEEVAASHPMMEERIRISNEVGSGWFWVAEQQRKIVGILSLQPTSRKPKDFVSWETSTDNGRLTRTFDERGKYLYVVALTAAHSAPKYTVDLLTINGLAKWLETGKGTVYFCSRMPGYHLHNEDMTAEEYFGAKCSDGKPLDPQLRMYQSMGFRPKRLVANAFSGDWESGEYGVLFVGENPLQKMPFRKLIAAMVRLLAKRRTMVKLLQHL